MHTYAYLPPHPQIPPNRQDTGLRHGMQRYLGKQKLIFHLYRSLRSLFVACVKPCSHRSVCENPPKGEDQPWDLQKELMLLCAVTMNLGLNLSRGSRSGLGAAPGCGTASHEDFSCVCLLLIIAAWNHGTPKFVFLIGRCLPPWTFFFLILPVTFLYIRAMSSSVQSLRHVWLLCWHWEKQIFLSLGLSCFLGVKLVWLKRYCSSAASCIVLSVILLYNPFPLCHSAECYCLIFFTSFTW